MKRRLHRRKMRRLVRDYTLDAMEENPSATAAEIESQVRDELTEDFGDAPEFLAILMKLLEVLLPLLLSLKQPEG